MHLFLILYYYGRFFDNGACMHFIVVMFCLVPVYVSAADRQVVMPQVARPVDSSQTGEAERRNLLENQMLQRLADRPDYQAQVINDPRFTNFARAEAVRRGQITSIPQGRVASDTSSQDDVSVNAGSAVPDAANTVFKEENMSEKNGGNRVVIHQRGGSNETHIYQQGDRNSAVQRQEGTSNLLYIEQVGGDNHSEETQIGDHNIKIEIQRDGEDK